MKKSVIIFCFFFLSTSIFAHTFELLFNIRNNQGALVSGFTVGIYKMNGATGAFEFVQNITSGSTAHVDSLYNIVCDIQFPDGTIYTQSNNPTATVPWVRYLVIKFGSKYIRCDEAYDAPPNNRCGDMYLDYNTDTQELSVINNPSYWSTIGIYNWSDSYAFTLQNSFSSGTVKLRTTDYNHNTTLTRLDGSFPHTISPTHDGQVMSDYERKYRNWVLPTGTNYDVNHDLTTGNLGNRTSNTVQAKYAAKCNLNFEYKYQGKSDNTGTIYVNSTSYSSPASLGLYDDITQSAYASVQNLYGVVYSFNSWKKVVGTDTTQASTSQTYSFNPTSHAKYIATLTPSKPVVRNFSYIGSVGDNIQLSWSENSTDDSRITYYKIWRRVRHNGVTGDAALIATVARGTTTYTDYDYKYTSSYTDDLLWYDVRVQLDLSSGTVYADENLVAVYGVIDTFNKISGNNGVAKQLDAIATEYSLGNYPNPFNPTTVIRYTMPEAGQVSLKVYNILSQEVANLVESNQSAGVHQVNFNASHLPTGIYIARLQAGAKVMTTKLQLVK